MADTQSKNETEIPCCEPLPGIYQFSPLSHTFPPISRTNCFLMGDTGSPRILVDPSPLNEDEYLKFRRALQPFEITRIFITHHHPDHHEFAPRLARELSVDITISKDSHQRILNRRGSEYFSGISVHFAQEGDIVTFRQGKGVKVYEIPGHDAGHLGLAPEGLEWFLVGDLIQGMGTVVIGLDEGDMAKYFVTLQRIIDLNPKYLLLSHGQMQKSVQALKKTLQHRIKREAQVLKLYQNGKTAEQIVDIIYRGINRRLWAFAVENVRQHLRKLRSDGAITIL